MSRQPPHKPAPGTRCTGGARICGLPGGGLNIAHEAVDRHARGPRAAHEALRWLDAGGRAHAYSYAELAALSARFANVLRSLGIGKGARVFSLLGREPALYAAALGTFKNGSVFCPLFAAFGPQPVRTRLVLGDARVLVTSRALYERKIAPLARPAGLAEVLLVDADAESAPPGTRALAPLLAAAEPEFRIPPTDPEDPALLHFTSGTTGRPKGAVHVHAAVRAHVASARAALDLGPGDVFWCTADPGWVTGMSYGVIAPLALGATLVADSREFDAERWYAVLQDQRVTVWYTSPTAVRMLMRFGEALARRHDTASLRLLAAVGEPLNPEAVRFGERAFGKPFHDTWWQTETGAIMIANPPGEPVRPGAMGRPLPGVEAAILRRGAHGMEPVQAPDTAGELALRRGWPSQFRGYLDEPARYRACFAGEWYLSGDLARCDGAGYYWFIGRGDDVIQSAGHLIGPFEVESALLEHPAVAEAAAIGVPDPVTLERVRAFVALKPGRSWNEDLRRELLALARRRLGPAVAPREIEHRAGLPKTRSGKILRRLLRAEALGLPEGDLSTLARDGAPNGQ